MSVYGRRRGLKDLRGLFKIKEVQYKAPVSRLAGFVIQQVSIKQNSVDSRKFLDFVLSNYFECFSVPSHDCIKLISKLQ